MSWMRAVAVAVALTGLAGRAGAVGFDIALDWLEVTGNQTFFDDFEDGLRDAPPTSLVVDAGTTASEANGLLHLRDADGYVIHGFGEPWIAGSVDLAVPIVDQDSGTTTIRASLRPELPPADGISHHFLMLYHPETEDWRDSVELGVQYLFGTTPVINFYDNRFCGPSSCPPQGYLGWSLYDPATVTGFLVLELTVDHVADTVTARYSLDGGSTYVEPADWTSPPLPGPAFDGGDMILSVLATGLLDCDDGLDNDADGLVDWPDDPGCSGLDDSRETTPDRACDDGEDNDGDTLVDSADPSCPTPHGSTETAQCDDGDDNDGDGLVDFADPQCQAHWPYTEGTRCGLGAELTLVLAGLVWMRRRRQG
ncbi:MAG: hypothetical protein QNK03_22730 [Myxococcota bacterium]|nr:hypothetical protein [Myxococcota bacterium]